MAEFTVKHDLTTRFGTIYGDEEISAVAEVIRAGAATNEERVRDFEKAFAEYCGVRHAMAVTSGTTALNLGCVAAGVGRGDRVLVPAVTWIATANAAALQGADVAFVDIDPETFNMDPGDLERKITEDTKLIIPVHLYGQPCDMDPIMDVAEDYQAVVMTDCAHAPGAEYKGRMVGSLAHLGAFSFHQQKNMSTLGEGGMLTTDDDRMAQRAEMFRNHGRLAHSHEFSMIGHNYRMTEVQGTVGIIQLGKLDSLNERRISNARLLTELISDVEGIRPPTAMACVKHVFHLYNLVIDADEVGFDRERFLERLGREYGIAAGTHYEPIHLAGTYAERGRGPGDCPVAEKVGMCNITLPMHPRIDRDGVRYMAEAIANIAAG